MRKSSCFLFCLIICLILVCIFGFTVFADEEEEIYICDGFTYRILEDDSAEILEWTNESGESVERLVIPEYLDGHAVTAMYEYFYCDDNPSVLVLPLSINDLSGHYVNFHFSEFEVSPDHPTLATIDGVLYEKKEKRLVRFPRGLCLENFRIPDGVKSIGEYAFENCDIEQIYLPESLTDIMDHSFLWSNIQKIHISSGVTSIDSSAFFWVTSLDEFVVSPDNPVFASIDGVLFNKVEKTLVKYPTAHGEEYSIPDGIKGVEDDAFSVTDISSIHFPQSCLYIGSGAFSGCRNLSVIELPDNLASIGDIAFNDCPISYCYIPESVTYIGINPFVGCMYVEVSQESKNFASIDGVLFDKIEKKLICYPMGLNEETYVVPDGIKTIALYSFNGTMDILHSIELPETISLIEDEPVPGTFLETLPPSAEIIVTRDSYAADYCKKKGLNYKYKDANDWLNE